MLAILEEYGLHNLSIEQKVELADALWNSILQDQPVGSSSGVIEELKRRISLSDSNPERGTPWSEVRKNALSRRKA